eukprot:9494310-Pyramimonas_sp.AAC.1
MRRRSSTKPGNLSRQATLRGRRAMEGAQAETAVEGQMAPTTPRCSHALPTQWAPLGEPLGIVGSLTLFMGVPSLQTPREWNNPVYGRWL